MTKKKPAKKSDPNRQKYSIKMEGDELLSVRVGGVTYASAADIPDPNDRAQIEALIAQSGDDDAGDWEEISDERISKRELEAHRDAAKFPTLFVVIFTSVAVLMLGIAIFWLVRSVGIASRNQAVPGQVVELVEYPHNDSQTGRVQMFSYPVVEFEGVDGKLERVELNAGSYPPQYRPGDQVTVLYDPDHPENARIQNTDTALELWLLPALTGFLGIVFLGVTLIALWLHKKQVREYEEILAKYHLQFLPASRRAAARKSAKQA